MATYTKFQPFVENLAEGKFNFSSDSTCTITAALSASAPTNTWSALSEATVIDHSNLSSRVIGVTSSSQTSGTYKLVLADTTLTASGAVPTFRYIILYDDDSTTDLLIAYYDYGSNVTMASGDTFVLNFSGTEGVFQIA